MHKHRTLFQQYFSVKAIVIQCFFLLICSSQTAFSLEKVTLQLKWKHQFQFAGYYAAIEKGFYSEEGLDVTLRERASSYDHIKSVIDGETEYGISDSNLILYRLKGMPIVILGAIFQHSPLILMTRDSDKILGPYELKGKRVMWQKGLDDASITAMLHQMGISDNDVIHVPHNFDNDALRKSEVDAMSAYLTDQPYRYKELGIDIHIIDPNNYGIDFYGDMLFTSEEEIRSNPNRVKRFLKASLKGWEYALNHEEEVIQWLKNKYGVENSLKRLRYEADATKKMIRPDLVKIGHFNVGRFNRIADIYRKEKLVPLNGQLHGIDFRDYLQKKNGTPNWIWFVLLLAFVILIVTMILGVINRKLKQLVLIRTEELEKSREKQQKYLDVVDNYVISSSTDIYGTITEVSDAFCQISKYSRSELIGQSHNIIRHPDMPKNIYEVMWENLKSGKCWSGEVKNKAKDGSIYWVDAHIDPKFNDKGEIEGYTSIRRDITDKKYAEALSITDTLTKLYNRLKLDQKLIEEYERAKRYHHPLSVIMFDVDKFKEVNDTFGHLAGDIVLTGIADIVRNNIRKTDCAGRWGGEEFLIICPETSTLGAIELAESLRVKIELNEFEQTGQKTCSFGIAALSNEDTIASLISRSDKAMYQAKKNGRNQVVSELSLL